MHAGEASQVRYFPEGERTAPLHVVTMLPQDCRKLPLPVGSFPCAFSSRGAHLPAKTSYRHSRHQNQESLRPAPGPWSCSSHLQADLCTDLDNLAHRAFCQGDKSIVSRCAPFPSIPLCRRSAHLEQPPGWLVELQFYFASGPKLPVFENGQ